MNTLSGKAGAAPLTDAELGVKVAQTLGYTVYDGYVYDNTWVYGVRTPEGTERPGRAIGDFNYATSYDLAAGDLCARIAARRTPKSEMVPGAAMRAWYAQKLCEVVREAYFAGQDIPTTDFDLHWALAKATPRDRCIAFLRLAEEHPGPWPLAQPAAAVE